MPYAFAHPAAVIPVARLLGRRAAPSALVIGSVIPDAWYLVPLVAREHSHGVLGILWFCIPAGLIAYAAFHLIFKQPMLALLPRALAGRLAAWSAPGLPPLPWRLVVLSLLAGILTHLAWDAATHAEALPAILPLLQVEIGAGFPLYRVLQHASTLLGAGFVVFWLWRKVSAIEPQSPLRELAPRLRLAVLAAMVIVPAAAFASALPLLDTPAWRSALRAGAVLAACALGLIALVFCLAWRRLAR